MITLAKLRAFAAIVAPGECGALNSLLALAPHLAVESGVSIDSVYAMPARDAILALSDMIPNLITTENQQEVLEIAEVLRVAFDPEAMKSRMINRLLKAE